MNMQKIKEALENIITEESAKQDWDGIILEYAKDALAELSVQESASGDDDRDLDIFIYNIAVNFCGSHSSEEYRKAEKHAKKLFIQFAQSYHAKECAKCKAGKWISVSEKNPQLHKTVLLRHWKATPFIGYLASDDWRDLNGAIRDPTHWQEFSDVPDAENQGAIKDGE